MSDDDMVLRCIIHSQEPNKTIVTITTVSRVVYCCSFVTVNSVCFGLLFKPRVVSGDHQPPAYV